jgi:putative peptide zinc metalloprotease protein
MDALEIPNLRQKSTEVLKRGFQKTCLGLELQDDPFLPTRGKVLFGAFTVASVIYRWVVVFSICWFVIKVLEPYGLQAIGRMVAVVGFAGLVMQPIIQTWKFCRTPGRLSKVKRTPLLVSLGVLAAILALVCYVPLPHHIDCALEIRPSQAGTVYAGTPGQIEWTVSPREYVTQDDAVAILRNPDLEIRLADLTGRQRIAEVELQNLSYRSRSDVSLKAQIDTQEELLAAIRVLRTKTEEEIGELTVRAPRTGYVIPPMDRPTGNQDDGRLPTWEGSPLEERNRGAMLTAEDVICEIGNPEAFEAVLVVDQGDVQLVKVGQEVDIKLDAERQSTYHGEITEKSSEPISATSLSMASQTGGDLQTEIDPATGQVKPRSISYQARVPLVETGVTLRPGYRGSAKVHVDPMSLGSRLWRVVAQTFNFEI